jgi:signal peptidase I
VINKPRKPWISGILTIFSIGLGHIYTGEVKRGIILFFIGQVLLFVSASFLLLPAIPLNFIAAILIILTFVVFCIVDAVRLSKKSKLSYELKKYNKWYFYLPFALITIFAIQPIDEFVIKKNIVQAYKIPSGAMKPNLIVGDHILVNKLTYNKVQPNRGDIIVFKYPVDPKKAFIKRVIGIGGDVVESRDKKLYVNHEPVNPDFGVYTDPHIIPGNVRPRDNFGPIKVPDNSLFVMGDNRDESFDSRFWGYVDLKAVNGKAFIIYWSWDKHKFEARWDRIGSKL